MKLKKSGQITKCSFKFHDLTNFLLFSEVEIDEEDSSVTRPEELVKKLFHCAGLKIITELKQQKMPKGLYPVKMFVLQSNS